MLDAALAYGARGWQVFPCRPRAKTPLTTDGFKSATTDEGTIRAWWSSTPTANVGIATGASGLLLLDVDIDDDVRGDLSLIELEQRCDRLPDTLVCWTPRGCGFHLYYALPPGVEVPCSTGRLGPGLDVRSTGGYTIAPPSIHPNGDRYLWPDPDADVTPAPDWLLELCRKPTPPPRPVSEGFEWSLFRMTRGYADAAFARRDRERVGRAGWATQRHAQYRGVQPRPARRRRSARRGRRRVGVARRGTRGRPRRP